MTILDDEAAPDRSRVALLAAAAAAPLVGLFGGLAGLPARAAERAVRGHDPKLVPNPDVLWGWLKQLHKFGPVRNTGTAPCRAFEEWLAKSFADLGCTIERDQFRLTSWECELEDCRITVREDGGAERTLDVLAYYPYSGSTRGKASVSGRLLFGGTGDDSAKAIIENHPASVLAESIVVIDMPLKGSGADSTIKSYPDSFPSPLPPLVAAANPATNVRVGLQAMAALETKCRGLILCYTDISKDSARYNYLPFTDKHRQIPGLWVGADDSEYIKKVSGKATATMRCDAKLTPDARADTILATLKGRTDEVVLMTTQTDGPNECNENGALGLLAAATYLSKVKDRRRTFVFSLPTGHYAIGPVADPVTGSGRPAGTTGVIAKWPDMIARAVAQIQLEQMAATEWADVGGTWRSTGRPAQQHWIPTPSVAATINRLFMAATKGEDPKYSRSDLVESGFPGGEGGPLRARNIPGIGLMGWPHYFFRADPKGVIDKLSPEVMYTQVSITTKLLVLMDRLTPEQLKGAAPISDAEIFG